MNGKTMIFPLKSIKGHIFVENEGRLWFIDTGSPNSFGEFQDLTIGDEKFTLDTSYCNLNSLTTETLMRFVGVSCAGLLGMDILGRFDLIFDIVGGKLIISANDLFSQYYGKLPGNSNRGYTEELHIEFFY